MLLTDFVRSCFFCNRPRCSHQVDCLPCVTVGLGGECRCEWNDVVTERILVEGVLPSLEDFPELVGIIDQLDATRSTDTVLGRLDRAIKELQSGTVVVERLVERDRDQDLAVHLGQNIKYVDVDDEKTSRDRVASPTKRSRPTTPRTTRQSGYELSRAYFPP